MQILHLYPNSFIHLQLKIFAITTLTEDTKSHQSLPPIPLGITPSDQTYTTKNIQEWIASIMEYCAEFGIPLVSISCDNASVHRKFIADCFSYNKNDAYPFPLRAWPFALQKSEELQYPVAPLQDPKHWLRCSIQALFTSRRLIMLGIVFILVTS